MVVFTCGHCGESVQKPKVEKHYLTVCRNRNPNLSCMDCFKDFFGKDYEAHVKCITEEERYSGKGYVAKEKKGEKKQNAWVEMLQSVLDEQKTASKNVLRIIETIRKHNNTPRKKPKFINFVKNVCGSKTTIKDIDQAWNLISVKLSALSTINSENKNESQKENGEVAVANGEVGKINGEAHKKNGEIVKTNGHANNGELNGDGESNGEEKFNGEEETNDGETQAVNDEKVNGEHGEEGTVEKKLSKKQRKEEKKRKKYEAELQSVNLPPTEIEGQEIPKSKKDKKKNKSNSVSEDNNAPTDGKNKNKKRKRQDTVGAASDTNDIEKEGIEVIQTKKEIEKKKIKIDGEDGEADESECLHNQNVARSEEINTNGNGKFNWHAVIMSVLEKKGNEVPFKRLQKKVLAEYMEATGNDVDDRIADKFIKKLKSAPNVRVDKNRVLLLSDD